MLSCRKLEIREHHILTVLEPAINAPKPPTQGEKLGQALPATEAALWANNIGMLLRVPSAEAEWINTCTIGTASNKAGAAADIVRAEAVKPSQNCLPFMRKIPIQISDTKIRIAPGENKN